MDQTDNRFCCALRSGRPGCGAIPQAVQNGVAVHAAIWTVGIHNVPKAHPSVVRPHGAREKGAGHAGKAPGSWHTLEGDGVGQTLSTKSRCDGAQASVLQGVNRELPQSGQCCAEHADDAASYLDSEVRQCLPIEPAQLEGRVVERALEALPLSNKGHDDVVPCCEQSRQWQKPRIAGSRLPHVDGQPVKSRDG